MSITTSYVDAARSAQERWVATLEQMSTEWAKTMPMDVAKVDTAAWTKRAHEGIDRSFTAWTKALEIQRQAAYQVADANIALVAALQGQAAQMGEQVGVQMKQAGEQVKQAARVAADAVVEAATTAEQSVKEATETARTATSTGAKTTTARASAPKA